MGSYFGSSLCAVDLNQDGLSDLLVGAPMHSQLRDEGQVSVYLSKGNVSGTCRSGGTWHHTMHANLFDYSPACLTLTWTDFFTLTIFASVDFTLLTFKLLLNRFLIMLHEYNSESLCEHWDYLPSKTGASFCKIYGILVSYCKDVNNLSGC